MADGAQAAKMGASKAGQRDTDDNQVEHQDPVQTATGAGSLSPVSATKRFTTSLFGLNRSATNIGGKLRNFLADTQKRVGEAAVARTATRCASNDETERLMAQLRGTESLGAIPKATGAGMAQVRSQDTWQQPRAVAGGSTNDAKKETTTAATSQAARVEAKDARAAIIVGRPEGRAPATVQQVEQPVRVGAPPQVARSPTDRQAILMTSPSTQRLGAQATPSSTAKTDPNVPEAVPTGNEHAMTSVLARLVEQQSAMMGRVLQTVADMIKGQGSSPSPKMRQGSEPLHSSDLEEVGRLSDRH